MFDTKITEVKQQPNYPQNVNVKEEKAPTDESIRLLNEFEDKARKNFIKKFPIESNIFKGEVYLFRDVEGDWINVHIRYILNGEEVIIEEKKSVIEAAMTDNRVADMFSEFILETLSRDLASRMKINME